MLSLTRKPGEALLIGDDIIVTTVKAVSTHCKLQIIAPNDVRIVRYADGQHTPVDRVLDGVPVVVTLYERQDVQIGPANLSVGEFQRNQVRLGIAAPRDVNILRQEVAERQVKPEPGTDRVAPEASSEDREQRELLKRYGFTEQQR